MTAYTQYQARVERQIMAYCQGVTPIARNSGYLDILQKNTERLQGALVLLGYELCGGQEPRMIERAALAIELFHAYIQCLEQNTDTPQALRGMHEAEIILANLETDMENRLKAVSITNRTLMLANLARLEETSRENMLHWRATELALNPIHVGQVLAGSDCDANNAVTPLATETGMQLARGEAINNQQFFDKLRKITW